MAPPGPGPSATLALARQKIQGPATRLEGGRNASVGLLSVDASSAETQAPLAIVCTFESTPPDNTLAELHRLAWNFSSAPLLLTVDQSELRAFTCSEPPSTNIGQELKPEIAEARYIFGQTLDLDLEFSSSPHASLHWLELASGSFLRKHHRRFRRKNRADNLLLDNLRMLRSRLHLDGLPYEVIHDLLARTIFVQFLFDRKDTSGNTALSSDRLAKLQDQGLLLEKYDNFSELLLNYDDTYRLFDHLDQRFNGDLFPSTERDPKHRLIERNLVTASHLEVLSDFISGRLSLRTGQHSLWPLYSFDTIPLDFISSIYESFVEHDGQAIYTPSHVVDFILDGILPWNDTNWDLKILDPSCGSGIFLVKALRRIIHRWKLCHGVSQGRIPVQDLRGILENNLFGVDINAQAIRVASFSLHLAMCDEIDPKYLWSSVRFPTLRDTHLVTTDFFADEEEMESISQERYDVIVGNAPWGKNTATKFAKKWAAENGWPVSYGDIGPLFLAKGTSLRKTAGVMSLMQPTGTLLTNRSAPAKEFRERLFLELDVREVVNLSALRFGLFRDAVGPSSLVTLGPSAGTTSITYICPKPMQQESIDGYRIVVDQYDVHEVTRREAALSTDYWTVLFWGTRRDLALVRKLRERPSLLKYEAEGKIIRRQGIIRSKTAKIQPAIVGRRILEAANFPAAGFLRLKPEWLGLNEDARTHDKDSTDFAAFEPVQMLIKMSWTVSEMRFRAVLVDSVDTGVLCTQGYISVRADTEYKELLEAACITMNSRLAVYCLLGYSGRFATYRPAPEVDEVLDTPILELGEFDEVDSFEELDARVYAVADLKESERALADHAIDFVLPDLKGGGSALVREATERGASSGLKEYCTWFMKMLKAGIPNNNMSATILEEPDGSPKLPVRFVAISLGGQANGEVAIRRVETGDLWKRIASAYGSAGVSRYMNGMLPNAARVFGLVEEPNGGTRIPTVFVVKSDQARYWSPAMAIRDADDVAAKLFMRGQQVLVS